MFQNKCGEIRIEDLKRVCEGFGLHVDPDTLQEVPELNSNIFIPAVFFSSLVFVTKSRSYHRYSTTAPRVGEIQSISTNSPTSSTGTERPAVFLMRVSNLLKILNFQLYFLAFISWSKENKSSSSTCLDLQGVVTDQEIRKAPKIREADRWRCGRQPNIRVGHRRRRGRSLHNRYSADKLYSIESLVGESWLCNEHEHHRDFHLSLACRLPNVRNTNRPREMECARTH